LEMQLNAEMYCVLRKNISDDTFIEKSFDLEPYTQGNSAPSYLLTDTIVDKEELRKDIETDIVRLSGGYSLLDYIFFFFVFCFIGWLWEVLLHLVQYQEFVNRGTLYGPWLPIYGTGGVIMILLLGRYKDKPAKFFILAVVLCGILEYASSFILEFIYNSSYWDYKDMLFNLNGRICLAGLIAFGLGGLFAVYAVAPRLSIFLDKLGKKKATIICTVLVVLFTVDLGCCAVFGFNSGEGVGSEY